MKLVRFGPAGREQPGVWLEKSLETGRAGIVDVRASVFDIADFDGGFFARGGVDRLRLLLEEKARTVIDAEGVRLGPPVFTPGQILCVGTNYLGHIREFKSEIPREPVYFAKAVTSLNGPFDPVILPEGADIVDGETELAVVIGRTGRRIPEGEALSHVAGYAVLNDVTNRAIQRSAGQWFRGKSADTFCPFGPFLVTPDEITDPHNLRLRGSINGRILQEESTSQMIFRIPRLISVLSQTLTLRAGDILSTGTPEGIGSAHTPPVVLRDGDVLEAAIDGLGAQKNPVYTEQ